MILKHPAVQMTKLGPKFYSILSPTPIRSSPTFSSAAEERFAVKSHGPQIEPQQNFTQAYPAELIEHESGSIRIPYVPCSNENEELSDHD